MSIDVVYLIRINTCRLSYIQHNCDSAQLCVPTIEIGAMCSAQTQLSVYEMSENVRVPLEKSDKFAIIA